MEQGTVSLAEQLEHLREGRPAVLALSERTLPLAREIAGMVEGTCDVLAVRRLRAPVAAGTVVGAIAEGTGTVFDESALAGLGLYPDDLMDVVRVEREALKREVARHRDVRRLRDLRGRTAILVGDDVDTGVTILAAIAVLRGKCDRIVVLALEGSPQALDRLREHVDEVITLEPPRPTAQAR